MGLFGMLRSQHDISAVVAGSCPLPSPTYIHEGFVFVGISQEDVACHHVDTHALQQH